MIPLLTFLIGFAIGAGWIYLLLITRLKRYENQMQRLSQRTQQMEQSVRLARDLARQLDADLRGGQLEVQS